MDGRISLLRLRDLTEAVGVPKSTVRDWLADFAAFIPTVRDGNILCYRPEAMDVLRAVQEMRSGGLSKAQIVQVLADRGFAINEEPPVALEGVMTEWDASVRTVAMLSDHAGRIQELERQVGELRAELAAAREQKSRWKWWPF